GIHHLPISGPDSGRSSKATLIACLVVIPLASVNVAGTQKTDPILDQIARSVPREDPAWKHTSTGAYKRGGASTQASIKWNNGDIQRGATVIVHPTVKSARRAFRPGGKEDLQEAF